MRAIDLPTLNKERTKGWGNRYETHAQFITDSNTLSVKQQQERS